MTWEELKQKAKELGATICMNGDGNERIEFQNLYIIQNGQIIVEDENVSMLSSDRTPFQMWQIMEALKITELNEINALRKENKRLQEQLKEANEVIDACCSLPETNWVVIDSYKEKWGVK